VSESLAAGSGTSGALPVIRKGPSERLGELDPLRIPSPLAHMTARDLYALHGLAPDSGSKRLAGGVMSAPTATGMSGASVKFLLAVILVAAAAIGTTFVDAMIYGKSGAATEAKSEIVTPAPTEPIVLDEPTPDPAVADPNLVIEEPVAEAPDVVEEPTDVLPPVTEPATTATPRKSVAKSATAKPAAKTQPQTRKRRVLTLAQREEAAKQAEKARKKRLKELEKARKEREKRRRP
jgi:hypothetical protein